jgi:chromosome segregation ATPase
MEKLQNDFVFEEEERSDTDKSRFENDVLRLRMELMTRDHEAETNKIMKAKENTIENLRTTNEELNTKIGDQADKIQQMDKASLGKDEEMKSLTKRADELSKQKNKLEMDLKHASVMYKQSSVNHAQQDKRIKKLESELSEVKEELKAIRIAKEEQVSFFATYLKDADKKQEQYKRLHDMIQEQHAEMLCQFKDMVIRSKSPTVKDSKLKIMDARTVQISFDSPNGRNDAVFHRRTTFNNRQTCKPSKGNNNLPK